MISLSKLRRRHAKPVDGLHAYAFDVKWSPRCKMSRVVQYGRSIQDATDRMQEALGHEDRGRGMLYHARQLSGPLRVYKLGKGVAL